MKLKFNINSNVVKSKNNLEIARKYHHYDNVESIHVTANEDVYHIDAVVSVFNHPQKCSLDIKDNQVVSYECSCPFNDQDSMCGHLGAVILKLNELEINQLPFDYQSDKLQKIKEIEKENQRQRRKAQLRQMASMSTKLIDFNKSQYQTDLRLSINQEKYDLTPNVYLNGDKIVLEYKIGNEKKYVLKNIADERNFPIFQTEMITGVVSSELMNTLEEKLARETLMHGVFLNIHGKGVIIKGNSGIGKSEIALELVKRGHLLVADDAVELYRIGQKIVGKAPAVLANLLEIRGIGVIDVSKMFGISAILDRNDVDLVIQLERWVPSREYTRVGVEENDISEDVLGIKIPKIVVPVSSGRSMSVIIEAAVMNMRLRDVGIDSSKEFVERILKNIDHNKQEQ